MSVEFVTIFWIVNASSGEKSCLQLSIPTGSGKVGREVFDIVLTYSIPSRFTTPSLFPLLHCSAFFPHSSFFFSFNRFFICNVPSMVLYHLLNSSRSTIFLIRFTSSNYFHTLFNLTLQFFQGFVSLQLRSFFCTFQLYHIFPLSPSFILLPITVRHSPSAMSHPWCRTV